MYAITKTDTSLQPFGSQRFRNIKGKCHAQVVFYTWRLQKFHMRDKDNASDSVAFMHEYIFISVSFVMPPETLEIAFPEINAITLSKKT